MAAGIIDTNALILLEKLDPSFLPSEPSITAITLAELSVGPLLATADIERANRQRHLQQAEADFEALPFDAAAARAFGRVAASMRASGRKPTARSFDALIASIALARGVPLHTCNHEDFASIEDLVVIAIPQPIVGAGADD
jgi:tRNA(fMet)-specific endonuclease VapC